MKVYILIICVLCINYNNGARILVCVPSPSVSHQVVFYPLVNELINKGHEVVFITTDAIYQKGKAPSNLTEIDTHDVSYSIWREILAGEKLITGFKEDLLKQMEFIFTMVRNSFEKQVFHPDVQDLIKRKVHFDLLIIEAYAKSALSLSHVFKAPVILMSSFGSQRDNFELLGAPKYPKLLYPYHMHQKLNNMTVLEKVRVLWDVYNIEAMITRLMVDENAMVKRLFGPDTPSLEDMGDNVHMLFLNVYPIWEMNRPVPPGVVFIGGIHQKPQKDMPKDLKHYLDSSKKGIVYFSLGSNVQPSTLPAEKIQAITNGLAKLNYDVLVKWDFDELPGKGINTRVAKWLPQADLLCHPNIKAFITQGGLQSFDEALAGGVPFVGIPLLADQWYNVEMFVHLKIGIGLLMEELTEDKLVNAVNTVIEDPSYRQNMIYLRNKIRDQPESALQRAVWWTEHVIRHGGATHLRAPAANLSWTEYLDLELLAALAVIVLAALAAGTTALFLLVQYVTKYLKRSLKTKQA